MITAILRQKNVIVLIASLLLLICALPQPSRAATRLYTGQIRSTLGIPLIGASVTINSGNKFITGIAADSDGLYSVEVTDSTLVDLWLTVSAIGYQADTVSQLKLSDTTRLDFTLEPVALSLDRILVRPDRSHINDETHMSKTEIRRAARQSLVPTNPISAIKQPQVNRVGSNHSSQLRINGGSPSYAINGIEIGNNPNHYGMFSIIPSTVLSEVVFHAQGTPATLPLPSAVAFNTGMPFHRHIDTEFGLSFVEATGTWSVGNERLFMLGALRKSVLDKLAKQFDASSARRTFPLTNFEDLFLSTGMKISDGHYIIVDQYHSRDYLAYITDANSINNYGVDTRLSTSDHYVGARYKAVLQRVSVTIRGAVRTLEEGYSAIPVGNNSGDDLYLDLQSKLTTGSISSEICLLIGKSQITLGGSAEFVAKREAHLYQRQWNFLPPDANSDQIFSYQQELNKLYATYSDNQRERNASQYLSLKTQVGNFDLTSGFRIQQFGSLKESSTLSWRQRLTMPVGDNSNVSLYIGTFAENPVSRILEPYQILIRDHLGQLSPIKTKLATVTFTKGPFKTSMFAKGLDQLPVVTPYFSQIGKDGLAGDGFITMRSSGRATFYGGDITMDIDGLMSGRLDLYSFYGYTLAEKITNGVTVPYKLNARHRFFIQASYQLKRNITLGSDLAIRSGFAYTPTPSGQILRSRDRYTEDYYRSTLLAENSSQFPVNASLNLHLMINFGQSELYLSVSNVTNRGNAMINSADGFIYDAGILPSIGFSWKF